MKRLLLIVLPLLLIVGCSKPISEETLIDEDGLKYHPDTKELYSGKVFQNRTGGGKEFEGSYIDGKKDGHWTSYNSSGEIKNFINYHNFKKLSSLDIGKKVNILTNWYDNGNI